MAKLPDNFVKAPAEGNKKKKTPGQGRKRKSISLEKEIARRAHDILVRFTAEEHRALETACEQLRAEGEDITPELAVKRAVAFWLEDRQRSREAAAAQAEHDGVIAQLRRFAHEPMRAWRELNSALRRLGSMVSASRRPAAPSDC